MSTNGFMERFKEAVKLTSASPRLLLEAGLKPRQGDIFQPTGFPDIGPATYTRPDNKQMLLVESAQSMANRLEEVCWDKARQDLLQELDGLPYVKVTREDGTFLTSSVLEAHRINSPYVLAKGTSLAEEFKEKCSISEVGVPDIKVFAAALLDFDIFTLLHGVFISRSEYAGGRLRIPRAMSAFIEAEGVNEVAYGGVKRDDVDPTGKWGGGGAEEGFGHVPYPRVEFTAEKITAYFNIDLGQLRDYALGQDVYELLVGLALFKIDRFLESGLRLRTACDLVCNSVTVTTPGNVSGADLLIGEDGGAAWKEVLPRLIEKARKPEWKVRHTTFKPGKSKKARNQEE